MIELLLSGLGWVCPELDFPNVTIFKNMFFGQIRTGGQRRSGRNMNNNQTHTGQSNILVIIDQMTVQ